MIKFYLSTHIHLLIIVFFFHPEPMLLTMHCFQTVHLGFRYLTKRTDLPTSWWIGFWEAHGGSEPITTHVTSRMEGGWTGNTFPLVLVLWLTMVVCSVSVLNYLSTHNQPSNLSRVHVVHLLTYSSILSFLPS